MIMAEKSGFAFSKNSNNNLEISAIWGLGEGFNLKEISPDEYELSETLDFVNKKIGQKNFRVTRDSAGALKKVPSSEERKVAQVLNNYEIQRIGDLAEKIESHFQKPQKIDFSIDESGIYILQTRTLGEKTFEKISVSAPENKKPVEIEKVDKITKTKIKLFLDLPSLSEESAKSALRKVGLLEIEKEVEKTGKHPLHFLKNNSLEEYEKVIYDGLKKSAEHFDEIWIRCGNFVSENSLRLEGAISETNPLLGLHGIRFGLKYPDILKSELNAVKKISGKAKTGILIPNIVSVVELKKVREILKNLEMENVSVGIVIETPASVQLIKDFCSENLDLVLINTDGILQHLLAADKNNSAVSEILNFAHPSFMYQVEYLIRIAKRNGIETILFGSAIKNDEILRQVIQKGVDFVCVPATDAKATSEKIYEIEEELLGGTDLEPRKYEIAKEKKEYLNEENSFETSEQILDVDEGVKAIEAEKQEYLASSNEENL